jgi:hypothetical protein
MQNYVDFSKQNYLNHIVTGRGEADAKFYLIKYRLFLVKKPLFLLIFGLEGKNILVLYGCATNSCDSQFLRFESNMFYIDNQVYTDLRKILGVWHHIIQLRINAEN